VSYNKHKSVFFFPFPFFFPCFFFPSLFPFGYPAYRLSTSDLKTISNYQRLNSEGSKWHRTTPQCRHPLFGHHHVILSCTRNANEVAVPFTPLLDCGCFCFACISEQVDISNPQRNGGRKRRPNKYSRGVVCEPVGELHQRVTACRREESPGFTISRVLRC